eukprot:806045-Pelagomonas_calceolata.AAC.8
MLERIPGHKSVCPPHMYAVLPFPCNHRQTRMCLPFSLPQGVRTAAGERGRACLKCKHVVGEHITTIGRSCD